MADSRDSPTPEEVEEARWFLGLKDASTLTLLEQALALSHEDAESDKRWSVVDTLCTRGDVETFDAANNWCTSGVMIERELAADLLGRFGKRKDKDEDVSYLFLDRAVPLLEILLDDPEARVVASAVYSLSADGVYDPILARPSLGTHVSVFVRLAVARSLNESESRAAINTLVELSNDEEEDVRDWATFGLHNRTPIDTPEIREAFIRRLDDPNKEVRSERPSRHDAGIQNNGTGQANSVGDAIVGQRCACLRAYASCRAGNHAGTRARNSGRGRPRRDIGRFR